MTGQPGLFQAPLTGPGLDLSVHRAALDQEQADVAFSILRNGAPWQQDCIAMFGRKVAMPRLTAWFGDPGMDYTYSGMRLQPQPWTAFLAGLRERLEELAGTSFNSVLLNLYRDGGDGVAWHADDEPDLGRQPVIGSLSLGATRKFQLRRADDWSIKREFDLHHGDVVVMRGPTQELWRHQIPKTSKLVGERINLTFRTIVTLARPQTS